MKETKSSGSLATRAFELLQDKLVFLEIAPGEPLNETRLGLELEVGRTPLREALKRLETERLVATFPRRGTFATPVDITVLSEISEVREVLEPLAVRLAAKRLDHRSRGELKDLKDQLDTATPGGSSNPQDALRWDSTIHRALYCAAGNAHLEATLNRYGNLATRIWCLAATRNPTPVEHIATHSQLLDAVLNGRSEDAAEIMREHVGEFEQHMREVL
ncbi:GntR family transcriptional regulator [Kocuria marina]|uniref:DNA-binding transcriptional regulator, GntR family n=1 Tax=Kocuria marina subsp. indica TaxID=1049583 RepID=A0A1X7EH07_9MICC|nr:GntR family transcriptional regulator [Kocuria indica]OXS78845.1 GntR family transcriptional regulator [Kocuria indica]RLP56559.1 GntR family transcriptional regulator [Kocuria indica]SMF33404.1 DNA-binding transcriptional regulator, GntR family [Kocuria indica]